MNDHVDGGANAPNGTNNNNNGGHPSPAAQKKPFRIAIVGGAIGGLSTALLIDHFCNRAHHDDPRGSPRVVTMDVYEQAAEYREIGAGVGLGLNAARLMHTIPGLGARLNERNGDQGKPGENTWFTFVRYDDGREITQVDGPTPPGTVVRPLLIARSEYLDEILGVIRERWVANLHTSKKFVSVKDLGDQGIQMTFADGTTAEADLLLGSDGIHSQVRKQFVTDSHPLYSGKIAYRGFVPVDALPQGDAWRGQGGSRTVMWLGRHRHFLVFPICRARVLNIVAFASKREDEIPDLRESWTSTCDRAELEADFAGFDDTVQQIIRLMPARPSKWRINDHEPVPQWTFWQGRVTLLGDACHATTPHQGAGAGQAVEDGYILARALADWLGRGDGDDDKKGSLGEWMDMYQRIRLPRAQKIVVTSRKAAELYEFEQPDVLELSYDEAVPLVAQRLHDRMKWIWYEDLDAIYEKARQEAGL